MIKINVFIIVVALSISVAITLFLRKWDKPDPSSKEFQSEIGVSNDIQESSVTIPSEGDIGKNYFWSMGKLCSTITSKYIECFDEIRIEMSGNGQTYKEIPIHKDKFEGEDTNRLIEIGYHDSDQIHNEIYYKFYVPPQELFLPSNVSKKDVLNSLRFYTQITPVMTNKDKTKLFLTFLAILGTSIGILNLVLF